MMQSNHKLFATDKIGKLLKLCW